MKAIATHLLELPFSRPYDWEGLLAFLSARAIPGVERVASDVYQRTFRLGQGCGWLEVRRSEADHLCATVYTQGEVAPDAITARLRKQFDLDADGRRIDQQLARDPRFAQRVRERPGVRVPGAFEPFELAVRAILGQQISVAAATTLAARLVRTLGSPLPFSPPLPELAQGPRQLFPTPAAVAAAELTQLGLTRARAASLRNLAAALHADPGLLEARADLDATVRHLTTLPGVGAWTAHYFAMRALRAADAFPASDLGIARALAEHGRRPKPAELLAWAEAWRPFRAYATLRLWTQPA